MRVADRSAQRGVPVFPTYTDTGCEVEPACLTCTQPKCIEDMTSAEAKKLIAEVRLRRAQQR